MQDNKTSLKQDLIKILVDKLLIGILLVIIGLFSTNLIERLKSERGFSIELDKIRAQKIGEVWEKVYIYEAASEARNETLRELLVQSGEEILEQARKQTKHPPSKPVEELKDEIKKIEREARLGMTMTADERELADTLNKNRFWLGEDMYLEIKNYLSASKDYTIVLSSKDKDKIKDADKKKEESRATITKIRDRLLQGQ